MMPLPLNLEPPPKAGIGSLCNVGHVFVLEKVPDNKPLPRIRTDLERMQLMGGYGADDQGRGAFSDSPFYAELMEGYGWEVVPIDTTGRPVAFLAKHIEQFITDERLPATVFELVVHRVLAELAKLGKKGLRVFARPLAMGIMLGVASAWNVMIRTELRAIAKNIHVRYQTLIKIRQIAIPIVKELGFCRALHEPPSMVRLIKQHKMRQKSEKREPILIVRETTNSSALQIGTGQDDEYGRSTLAAAKSGYAEAA